MYVYVTPFSCFPVLRRRLVRNHAYSFLLLKAHSSSLAQIFFVMIFFLGQCSSAALISQFHVGHTGMRYHHYTNTCLRFQKRNTGTELAETENENGK